MAGIYDRDLASDSTSLAAIEVVLTGESAAGAWWVSARLKRFDQGQFRSYPSSLFLSDGTRRARSGVLLPGKYLAEGTVHGIPPRTWVYAETLTRELDLEAGDEAMVEIELKIGGGLALTIEQADRKTEGRFELWSRRDSADEWKRHSTYVTQGDGYKMRHLHEPGTLYRSDSAVAPGATGTDESQS